jgi:hypothetical protein
MTIGRVTPGMKEEEVLEEFCMCRNDPEVEQDLLFTKSRGYTAT